MLRTDTMQDLPADGGMVTLGKTPALLLPQKVSDELPEPSILPVNFVLTQNPNYMDIGVSEMDHNVHGIVLVTLYVLCFICALALSTDDNLASTLTAIATFCGLFGVLLCAFLGYYILRRRRLSSVRFERKKKRLLFKPTATSSPVIIDWQDVVAYLKPIQRRGMLGGYRPVRLDMVALHLAWFDKDNQQLHTFYAAEPYLMQLFCLNEWGVIRRYMNGDDEHFSDCFNEVPCSESFKHKGEQVWRDFVNNDNKRLFAFDIRNMSVSYFSVAIFYMVRLLGFWRIPYLLCDLYLALAIKPMLPEHSPD